MSIENAQQYMPDGNRESNIAFIRDWLITDNQNKIRDYLIALQNYDQTWGGYRPEDRRQQPPTPPTISTLNEDRYRELWAEAGGNADLITQDKILAHTAYVFHKAPVPTATQPITVRIGAQIPGMPQGSYAALPGDTAPAGYEHKPMGEAGPKFIKRAFRANPFSPESVWWERVA